MICVLRRAFLKVQAPLGIPWLCSCSHAIAAMAVLKKHAAAPQHKMEVCVLTEFLFAFLGRSLFLWAHKSMQSYAVFGLPCRFSKSLQASMGPGSVKWQFEDEIDAPVAWVSRVCPGNNFQMMVFVFCFKWCPVPPSFIPSIVFSVSFWRAQFVPSGGGQTAVRKEWYAYMSQRPWRLNLSCN